MKRLLLALLLVGCGEAASEPPTPIPLDPVDRTAALVWVLDEPEVLAPALAELAALPPTAVLFAGDLAPTFDGDDAAFDARLADAQEAVSEVGRRVDVLVEVAALVAPGPYCFDRSEPPGDPLVAERVAAVGAWLRERRDVAGVVLSFDRGVRVWDAPCSCAPCDSELPSALASRLTTVFAAYAQALAREGRTLWWSDRTGPAAGDVDPRAVMEPALADVVRDRDVPLRLGGRASGDHPWAIESPRLSLATQRRVAVDLDPVGARFGAGGAALFLLDDLYDQVRSHRARSAVGWFVDLASPNRTTFDDLAGRASLTLVDTLFRDLDADPDAILAGALGWDPDDPAPEAAALYDLAVALRGSGNALDLATHPLGLAVEGIDAGLPTAFPLAFIDPSGDDPTWAGRWFDLEAPTRATLAAVHQWGVEAESLVDDAEAALTQADALDAGVRDALTARLRTLDVQVRAWSAVVDADAALRFVQAAPQGDARSQVGAWLRADARTLREVADAVDLGVADGDLHLPVPVAAESLRLLADACDTAVGPGDATARPFPGLRRIEHSLSGDRYTVRWEVAPSSPGSVEWGNGWPLYDDGGSGGEDPAVFWTAWREQPLGPDRRVTYRVCAPLGDGFEPAKLCSSDRVLWTDR